MATTYSEIFASFKDDITDTDLILLSEDLQDETLISLLNKSITKCERICSVNMSRDDVTQTFENDIPNEVIDIIVEWMTVFWLKPYLNNMENLRNALNTKDFTFFSSANLLEKISNRYELARKHARSLTNEYSFIYADMSGLKT